MAYDLSLVVALAFAVLSLGLAIRVRKRVGPTGVIMPLALIIGILPRAIRVQNEIVLNVTSLVSMCMSFLFIALFLYARRRQP